MARPDRGTHAISSVYSGDAIYNAIGANLTQTVKAPGGGNSGPLTISTTGFVKLYGPNTGQYGGVTIFQDTGTNSTITVNPGASSVPALPGQFHDDDTCRDPRLEQRLRCDRRHPGNHIAPNQTALVLFKASGLSITQVIAGEIEIDSVGTGSTANTRFACNASVFAWGPSHLVE